MATVPEVRQIELRNRSVFFEGTKRGRGRVKHSILKRYVQAWLPILGKRNDLIVYVDGFAGRGKYDTPTGVEEGSPLVVYRAALAHTHLPNIKAVTHMFFIEKDTENAEALRANLKLEEESDKVVWHVLQGSFVDVMSELLQVRRFRTAPMLIFADPFGYSGTIMPMALMQTLARRPFTDLFINVMDSFALKWGVSQDRHEKTVSEFLGLGPEDWKNHLCQEGLTPLEKRERFMGLYKRQLQFPMRSSQDKEVYFLQFGMQRANSNTHIYHLLFATKNPLGMKAMKYAMWKDTQESGRLVFSEYKENKGIMVDLPTLRGQTEEEIHRLILAEFRGQCHVKGSEIAKFILMRTFYEVKLKQLRKLLIGIKQANSRKFDDIVYQF